MSSNLFFTGKQILITGATGFIGKHLCIRLKDLGADIYPVSTKDEKSSGANSKWLVGDLVDIDFVRSLFRKCKPDIIFHLAAHTSGLRDLEIVQSTYHNNLTSTINILTASAEAGVKRLILAGSMEEPEEKGNEIIPVSPYAASKYSGTLYARMFYNLYDTPVTVPRIFMVYGPGDNNFKRLVPYVIRSLLLHKKPKLSKGSRLIDWIYIDDVVEGLVKMANSDMIEGKTIDLGSGNLLSIRELCKKIKTVIDRDIQIEFGAVPERAFERIRVADLRMARSYLNWKPRVPIDEGLRRTVKWFVQNTLSDNTLSDNTLSDEVE